MLRASHAMWLIHRATELEDLVSQGHDDPSAAEHATLLRRIAADVSAAVADACPPVLTVADRAALLTDARDLIQRVEAALRNHEGRDLAEAETAMTIACAFCEVAEAARS